MSSALITTPSLAARPVRPLRGRRSSDTSRPAASCVTRATVSRTARLGGRTRADQVAAGASGRSLWTSSAPAAFGSGGQWSLPAVRRPAIATVPGEQHDASGLHAPIHFVRADVASIGARSAAPRVIDVSSHAHLATPRARPSVLVITRRGRLVGTALATALLVIAGVGAVAAVASGPVTSAGVTVQPGQTLSQIAAVSMPKVPTGEAVLRLELTNKLTSSQVHAGQHLTIPAS